MEGQSLRADLHLHSRWSDGSLPIPALLELAKRLGLGCVAITDHDTLAGQPQAAAAAQALGIRLLPGLEISAFDPDTGRKVHILGYGIRDARRVEDTLAPYRQDRHRAMERAVELLAQAGYPIGLEVVAPYIGEGGILYRQQIMHALMDRGYALSVYDPLYRKLFKNGGIAQVQSSYLPALEAVELVRGCGGRAVLAHPFEYDSMDLLPALVEAGLEGIECYHPSQTPQRQRAVRQAAEQYGLFLTGGSDAHGMYTQYVDPPGSHGILLEPGHPLYPLD